MKTLNITIHQCDMLSSEYYIKNKIHYTLDKFIHDNWLEGQIIDIEKFDITQNTKNDDTIYKVFYNENKDENWSDEFRRLEIGL